MPEKLPVLNTAFERVNLLLDDQESGLPFPLASISNPAFCKRLTAGTLVGVGVRVGVNVNVGVRVGVGVLVGVGESVGVGV